MNVFTRTLTVVLIATVPAFAQAETTPANSDNAAIMAALDSISHRLDVLEGKTSEVKKLREKPAPQMATTPDINQAVTELHFDERNPMSDCRDVQCYGAGAVRQAFEYRRIDSVVMKTHTSCAILNPRGAQQIPCTVDEEAAGTHPVMVHGENTVSYDCTSLKCLGFLAIDDLATRKVITRISFPTKEACDTLIFELGHYVPCRGDNDTSPIVKQADAD